MTGILDALDSRRSLSTFLVFSETITTDTSNLNRVEITDDISLSDSVREISFQCSSESKRVRCQVMTS